MKKTKFFDIDLSENERKTLTSLIKIDHGSPKLIKKPLSKIYKETKIINPEKRRKDKGKDTHRGYQYRLLNGLIKKGIIEKDENKKYYIKPQFPNLAHSSLIQKKIKDSEKIGLFDFLDSTVFGMKNDWLKYPEMHHFHESLVNALSSLYIIKMIKKIFLLRDFSVKWKSFLDSDIPLVIKYWIWEKVHTSLLFFDRENENKFLEKQISILKELEMNEKEIKEFQSQIKKQHNDIVIEFRKKIGYKPKKYKDKTNKKFDLDDENLKEFINKKLNKKQKKQVDNILDWCLNIYPEEIKNTGFFVDLGNLNDPKVHFKIPVDYEEKLFRYLHDKVDFSRIESISKNIKKNIIGNPDKPGVHFEAPIDDSLTKLIDIWNERNYSRFLDRFTYLFIKLIQRPFFQIFYKQLDKKPKEKIISILRKSAPDSKDKTDYELFCDYALSYF